MVWCRDFRFRYDINIYFYSDKPDRMIKSSGQLKHNMLNMNGMPRNEVPRYLSLGYILAMAWCGVHDELNESR